MLISIYNLTDDETFSLWDGSDLAFAAYMYKAKLICLLYRIGFNICTVSAIGISVKARVYKLLVKVISVKARVYNRVRRVSNFGIPCVK